MTALSRGRSLSLLACALVLAAVAAAFARSRGIEPAALALPLFGFALLLIPYLGFGLPAFSEAVRDLCRRPGGGSLVAILLLTPAVTALPWEEPGRSARSAFVLLLYAFAPLAVLGLARRRSPGPSPLDGLALLLYWLPMELGLFAGFWQRSGIDPSFLLMKVAALSLLLAGFAGFRGLEGIGYTWRLRGTDLLTGSAALAGFLAISVPVALTTGFVTWAPRVLPAQELLFKALGIGLFIALPEEILFRGVMFNLMQRASRGRHGPWPALFLASIVFGLAHLNNPPLADVRYVMLATVAGIAYGWCYLRTGSLMGGMLAHTAVDLVHHLLLTTPPAP